MTDAMIINSINLAEEVAILFYIDVVADAVKKCKIDV